MKILTVSPENNTIRERFFRTIYGPSEGYVGVAKKYERGFEQAFFHYPDDLSALLEWINLNLEAGDLYYCPQLLTRPERVKAAVGICPSLWADLDAVDPDDVAPKPSVLIESSPGRYQALWLLAKPGEPQAAEEASRKVGYSNDADKSGWDLTQLLRIPLTYNRKYETDDGFPVVEIVEATGAKFNLEDFLGLEQPPEYKGTDEPFPEEAIEGLTPEAILQEYAPKLLPSVFEILAVPPSKDWSTVLWSLETMLFEAGMEPAEVFVVTESAAANKYKRDGRSRVDLWKEIQKAKAAVDLKLNQQQEKKFEVAVITPEEIARVKKLPPSFVEQYIAWAGSRTDAAEQYHEAGAFTILSAMLAEGVVLPTRFGNIVPNLWFMILGDTTLTRKTTAMEIAMEMLTTVYDEAMLATDGSIEGLLTALSTRANKTSLIWRDEFAGMLDAIKKREYYAGMLELLTKLYDGKYQKRVLRKETIEIRNSIFLLLAGGIKSRLWEVLDQSHITSGFLPRFIFITAEVDPDRYMPVGPPTNEIEDMGTHLIEQLENMRNDYTPETRGMIIGGAQIEHDEPAKARLTDKAWERYRALEREMVSAGQQSDEPDIFTPMLDRLSKSVLKCAVLLAATRQRPKNREIEVNLDDVLRAIYYLDRWLPHTIEVIQNAGKTLSEKTLDKAYRLIARGKDSRSAFMRSMKITSREAEWILDTLEQRNMILRTKAGKMEKLVPLVGSV